MTVKSVIQRKPNKVRKCSNCAEWTEKTATQCKIHFICRRSGKVTNANMYACAWWEGLD